MSISSPQTVAPSLSIIKEKYFLIQKDPLTFNKKKIHTGSNMKLFFLGGRSNIW